MNIYATAIEVERDFKIEYYFLFLPVSFAVQL